MPTSLRKSCWLAECFRRKAIPCPHRVSCRKADTLLLSIRTSQHACSYVAPGREIDGRRSTRSAVGHCHSRINAIGPFRATRSADRAYRNRPFVWSSRVTSRCRWCLCRTLARNGRQCRQGLEQPLRVRETDASYSILVKVEKPGCQQCDGYQKRQRRG